jgi:hypothetical protein
LDDHRTITQAGSPAWLTDGSCQTFSAFIVYAGLCLVFFGMPVIGRLSQAYLGGGTDTICHIWAIAWWPYAVIHHINPLVAHSLWAPAGYNLAWAADIPGPSLLIFPVTRIFGPVVSYNILCLIAPPAAAVSAFVLCHYVCGRFWPALLGGYIFGFSPYILSHILAHLFLIIVFPVPLAIYIMLLRIDGRMGRTQFVLCLIAILLFQFLCSTEIFATATVFGAIGLVLALILVDKGSRLNLLALTREICCAYGVVTILLAPYLYYVFAGGLPTPPNPAADYSNDLLTFALPPPVLLIAPHLTGSKLGHFFENAPWWEQAGYLGPGLWTIAALFAWSDWRTRLGRFLVLGCALIAIMSMGPALHIAGVPLTILPWRLFNALPLMNEALPGRFGMFLYLGVGVAAAIYLARDSVSFWWRMSLAGLSLLFIIPDLGIWYQVGRIPNFLGTPAATTIHIPTFFRSGQYKRYLARGDNVLVLPLGATGSNADLFWQAESRFYFNVIDWYGAIAPPDANRWPIMAAFNSGMKILDFSEQLEAFLGSHQVKAIIVDSSWAGPWPRILSQTGMTAVAVGGVFLYSVPPYVRVAFQSATAHQMAEKQAAVSFSALVVAADSYVDRGFPLDKLAPGEVQRLKLLNLPDDKVPVGAGSRWWQNLWLGSSGGVVAVGIVGNYQDLKFLVHDYGPDADSIFFPFPKRLSRRHRPKVDDGQLLITFTPEGLKRAARRADNSSISRSDSCEQMKALKQ